MEYIGRMAEFLICIVCLTFVPAGRLLWECEKQRENALSVCAERFYAGLIQEGRLTREAYEAFERAVKEKGEGQDFELMLARRYVVPPGSFPGAGAGIPVKILYRADIEELLFKEGEIMLEKTALISILLYGRAGLYYSCGGGVW